MNWRDVNKTKIKVNLIEITARPLLSSAVMALATGISFWVLKSVLKDVVLHVGRFALSGQSIATLGAIVIAVIVYAVCLFLTGAITRQDLELIPKGEKLTKFVRK